VLIVGVVFAQMRHEIGVAALALVDLVARCTRELAMLSLSAKRIELTYLFERAIVAGMAW
jgi:hypothetical protein